MRIRLAIRELPLRGETRKSAAARVEAITREGQAPPLQWLAMLRGFGDRDRQEVDCPRQHSGEGQAQEAVLLKLEG